MSGQTRTNIPATLQALHDAVKAGSLQLIIEPRLSGNPQERLRWFRGLRGEAIAGLGSTDVRYCFSSPEPLDLTQYDNVLSRNSHTTTDAAGQSRYTYRLGGNFIRASARSNAPYFDTAGLELTKFREGNDPFFLANDNEKTRFGIGVARIKDDYALVVRSREIPQKFLEDNGFLPQPEGIDQVEFSSIPNRALPWTAVVYPVPAKLAESIRRAHALTAPIQYANKAALLEACKANQALYAPVSFVAPERVVAQPAGEPARSEDAGTPSAEDLLPDALKAYGAGIEGQRQGSGSTRYRLVMNRNPNDAVANGSEWKQRFTRPEAVAAQLAKEVGFSLPLQQTRNEQQSFGIDSISHADALADRLGINLDALPVSPFKLSNEKIRSGRLNNEFDFRNSGRISVYLLEENGSTFFVAAADKTRTPPEQLVKMIKDRLRVSSTGKDELVRTEGVAAYYAKIPINSAVYEDLKAADIPQLQPSDNLGEEIQRVSQAPPVERREPENITIPITPVRQQPPPPLPEAEVAVLAPARDAKLIEALEKARRQADKFYIAPVRDGETVTPYAYFIIHPKRDSFRKSSGEINEEFEALGSPVIPKQLADFGERRSKHYRRIIAVPLPQACFTQMLESDRDRRATDSGYESMLLSHLLPNADAADFDENQSIASDVVREKLRARAGRIVEDEIERSKTLLAGRLSLTALLEPLAGFLPDKQRSSDSRGRIIQVQLPKEDWLREQITRLQGIRERLEPWHAASGTPPVSRAVLTEHAEATQERIAGRSYLSDVSGIMERMAGLGKQSRQKLQDEITRLEENLRIVKIYGEQPMHALVIQGPHARFSDSHWKALKRAVERPDDTHEGNAEVISGRMEGGYGREALTPEASGVLRIDEFSMPTAKGKKREKEVAVVLLTPGLYTRIEEGLKRTGRTPNTIGGDPIADGDVADAITRHFVPATPEKPKPVSLDVEFERLGHRAILVNQSGGKGQGAKPALYITVGGTNKVAAINFLALMHQHGGLPEEEQNKALAQEAEDYAKLRELQSDLKATRAVREACARDYDGLFDAKNFGHAHHILESLQGRGERRNDYRAITIQSEHLLKILQSPDALLSRSLTAQEQPIFYTMVAHPIESALHAVGEEAVLSLLRDFNAGRPIVMEDKRVKAYETLLGMLPPNISRLYEPRRDELSSAMLNLLVFQPEFAEQAQEGFSPTIGDLIQLDLTGKEAPPGNSPYSFVVSDANESRTHGLDNDTASARGIFREALADASEESPLIVSCALTPEMAARIRPREPGKGTYFKLAKASGEGSNVAALFGPPRNKQDAGRDLDKIAEGSRTHGSEGILGILRAFYEMASPERGRSR